MLRFVNFLNIFLNNFFKLLDNINLASNDQNDMIDAISSLNLDYKKWKFNNQETLSDFVSAGKYFSCENNCFLLKTNFFSI